MQPFIRSAFVAAFAIAPGAAMAQMVIEEPPLVIEEPAVVVEPPAVIVEEPAFGPVGLIEEDAVQIAMMNGMMSVEDVDHRVWDGNFEVEGTGPDGEDLEITIDGQTGAVLEIDD